MSAIPSSRLPLPPEPPRRRIASQTKHKEQRHPYQGVVVETTAKLVVNLVLSVTAITALAQLLSYNLSQQAKLSEIKTEVKQTEKRVNHLRADFQRYFDPKQAKAVMQEQSYRVDPTQRQVVWVDKAAIEEDQAPTP